jgi:hypothetical protein
VPPVPNERDAGGLLKLRVRAEQNATLWIEDAAVAIEPRLLALDYYVDQRHGLSPFSLLGDQNAASQDNDGSGTCDRNDGGGARNVADAARAQRRLQQVQGPQQCQPPAPQHLQRLPPCVMP